MLIVSDLPTNCRAYLQRLTDSKTILFVTLWTVYSVNDVFLLFVWLCNPAFELPFNNKLIDGIDWYVCQRELSHRDELSRRLQRIILQVISWRRTVLPSRNMLVVVSNSMGGRSVSCRRLTRATRCRSIALYTSIDIQKWHAGRNISHPYTTTARVKFD